MVTWESLCHIILIIIITAVIYNILFTIKTPTFASNNNNKYVFIYISLDKIMDDQNKALEMLVASRKNQIIGKYLPLSIKLYINIISYS